MKYISAVNQQTHRVFGFRTKIVTTNATGRTTEFDQDYINDAIELLDKENTRANADSDTEEAWQNTELVIYNTRTNMGLSQDGYQLCTVIEYGWCKLRPELLNESQQAQRESAGVGASSKRS